MPRSFQRDRTTPGFSRTTGGTTSTPDEKVSSGGRSRKGYVNEAGRSNRQATSGRRADAKGVMSQRNQKTNMGRKGRADNYGQPSSIPGPGGMRVNPAIIVGR